MSSEWSTPSSAPRTGTSGPRANFGQRLVAVIIDVVLLAVVNTIVSAVVGRTAGSGLGVLIGLAYYIYLEGSPSGQTIGKRAMNIRVVDFQTGGEIGFGRAAIRYVARLLSALPCLLGYFWMLWDKENQTWHDKLATSVVVPTADYPVAAWPG